MSILSIIAFHLGVLCTEQMWVFSLSCWVPFMFVRPELQPNKTVEHYLARLERYSLCQFHLLQSKLLIWAGTN